MIIDLSVEGFQTYIEDCEVCCRPVQLSYSVEAGKVSSFSADGA